MVKASSTQRSKQASPRRQRLLFTLLTFSSLTSGAALAAGTPLPTGGQFAAGAGAITATANGLAISQSSTHGIINWQSFSIAAGKSVNIANGAGATLNRVTGGDLSSIAGSLTATGSVYVVNPSGVVVLPGGKVTTGGSFVASTRNVSNSDFMNGGAMTLSGTSSGAVVNQGTITSANGDVILVGKSVSNSGSITAAKGTAALAAGDNVLLQASGDDAVLVNAGSGDVTNTGTIAAAQVALDAAGGNVYALATNDGGVIRATGTKTKDGHVYLTGGDGLEVDGAVSATNADGSGGTIVATAATVNIGATAKISANGTKKGGGTILIGGDRHGGSDPSVALSKIPIANAKTTTVAAGASISANAGKNGKGGNVVVWSDQSTSYSGSISAKGGATGGDGGFVEVSGKQHLSFVGAVSTVAPKGADGTLLLDPTNVTISTGATSSDTNDGATPTSTFNPTAGATSSTVNVNDLETALSSNNVVVTTASSGTANGDITVGAPIAWSQDHSLSLLADGRIIFSNVANTISTTGNGAITLSAAGTGVSNTGGTAINVGANISANGGTITIVAPNPGYQVLISNQISVTNTASHGAGTIVLKADQVRLGSGISPNAIVSSPGEVDVVPVSAGAVTVGDNDTGGVFFSATNTSLLTQNDVVNIAANLLVIGSTTTTNLSVVTQPAATETGFTYFDAALAKNLKFLTGTSGAVTQDVNTPIIVYDTGAVAAGSFAAGATGVGTGGLAAQTGGAVTLNNPANSVGTIAFQQTGAGGDIAFAKQGGEGDLVVGTVGDISGITTTGTGRTVTLTANETTASPVSGSQGIVANVTQTAGASNAIVTNNLVLQGASTSFTLNNTSNKVSTVAGSVSALNLYDSMALSQTSTTTLTASGTGTGTTNAAVQIVDSSDITLASGSVISDAAGGDIQLETGTKFSSGDANTLQTTGADTAAAGGHWRVYSQSPLTTGESKGGLTYGYIQYATPNTPSSPFGSTVQGTGNGFLYAYQPTVTATLTGTATKQYDGTATISAGLTYGTPSGVVAGDTVTLNTPTSGTAQTSAAVATPNVVNATQVGVTGVTVATETSTNSASQVVPVYNYLANSTATGTASITAAPLTIAGTKVYNGTTAFTFNQLSVTSAAVNGEVVTITAGTGASSSANARPATPYANSALSGLTISVMNGNALASNYSLPATGNLTITPLPITVTGTRQYDGTTGAASTLLTVTDAVGSDVVGLSGTGQTTSPHASTTPYALTSTAGALTGLTVTNTNYTTTGGSGTFTITPLPVTLTGTRVYNGATGAAANLLTVTNAVGTDVVSVTGTGQVTSPNASTTAYALTSTGGALTGLTATNSDYTTTGGSGLFTITPLPITVTGTRTYNGTTGASSTLLTVTDAVGSDMVGLTGTGQVTSANASTTPYTLTSTGGALTGLAVTNTNYTTTGGSGTFTITPLPITVTGTRNYDGTTGASSTLLTVTDTVGTDTVGLSGTGQTTSPHASSTPYSLTSTGGALTGLTVTNTNYTTTGGTGTFTITPLPITVSGTRNYNGTTGASSTLLTVTDTVGTDTVGLSGTGQTTSPNASTTPYALTSTAGALTGLTVSNTDYTTTGGSGTFTITPLPITVSGTRNYDGTTGASSTLLTVTDTVGTDTVGLSGTGQTTSPHASTTPYTLTSTGGALTGLTVTNANYTTTGGTGTFTITPLPITVTGTRNYDGTTGASSTLLTVTDTVGTDTVGLSGTGQTTSPHASSTPYSLTSTGGALTGLAVSNTDYTTTGGSGTFTITPLPITVSGTRNYNGTTGASSTLLTVTDTVGTDTVGLSGTGQTTSPNASTTPYALTSTGGALTGLTVSNTDYTTTGGSGTFTITPLPITVSGTRNYDGTTGASSTLLTVTDTVGTDTVGLSGTGQTTSPNASTTPYALTSTGGALTGLTVTNTNYTTTGGSGTFTITPLPVVLTGMRAYNGTTGAASNLLTVTNVVGTDTVGLSGTGAVSSPNASTTPYALLSTSGALTGLAVSNANYTTTGGSGTFTITAAMLTATANGSKLYDGMATAPAADITLSGLMNGDTQGNQVSITGTGVLSSAHANSYTSTGTNSFTLGTLMLTGTDANNYNLALGTFTVSPLPITVTGTRNYNGTTGASSTLLTVTDAVGSDVVGLSGTGQTTSPNASTTPYALTSTGGALTGLAVSNTDYTTTGGTGTFTITPLPITVSGTRNYDGTTGAASAILTVTDTVGTDTVGLGGTGQVTSPHASGTPYALTSTGGSLTGLTVTNTNYTTTGGSGTLSITALPITVTGTRTYNGTTGASSTLLTVTDTVGTDTVGLSGTGQTTSPNASTTPYALTSTAGALTGLTVSNTDYTTTGGSGTFTITPLAVTLTGTRTYDGMTDAAGTILSATNDLDGANLTIGGTGVLASKNVGNEALTSTGGSLTGLTLGGSAATNYTLASATGSVNVTKAGLVISAVTQTKTYDATTSSTGTPTITGLQTGDSVSGSPLTQAFNSPNVAGTNGSILSVTNFTGVNDGNGGGNYTVTVNTAMGTITPLAVTLTGTRTYDGMTDAAGTILSATNDLDGANLTIGGTGVLASKNVGNEALTSTGGSLTGLTLGGSAATNYTLASATGSVNVTKAGLVISAVTQTKTYDATTSSTGTPTITGLQTGDSVSGSPLTQAFNSPNVAGTNGSTLSVTNFTGVNDGNGGGNYTVTVNTAMGTITPLAVTLTGTRTYDGMTDAAGTILSASNDLDGANLTIGGTGVLASKNVGNEALTSTGGSLTGLTLGGSAATNYTLASATGSVNVTKAGLVISAVTQTKTYDATTSSTGTPTITGLQTGDSVSGSPLTQAFNSPNVAGTNGSILSVTNFTGVNDGNGGGNYTVTVNTAMGTITPLAVTLTGTRTYDGMTDAAGTILSATNDLDGANLTIGGTGVLASKNVGNEALTSTGGSLTGLTLGGSAATNYTLASATGSVNVTKAGLVISAVTQTKTYDATTSSTGTPTITGLQTGDSVSGSPLTQAFNSPNVAGTNGSTLSVTNFTGVNDGNGGGNYTVTVNTAMGTITPLAVTLTGTRTYDGMTDAAGTILSATNDLDGANLTIGGTGVLAGKNVGNEALTSTGGSLTGLTLGGSAATNYTLASATGSVNVTKAGLVISAVTDTKVYNASTSSTGTPTITGLQTGDSVSGSPLTQAFNSPNVAGTNGSTLSVTNFTGVNDGNGGGNYTVTVNTAMGTITPLAVTLTGTRTYDGMTDAAGTILSATNDLDGANLTIGGTGVLASKNVGNEALTSTGGSLTGLTLGGSAATNYTLASATGSVNVTKAGLVISAVTQTKTYDATTTSTGTPTVVGLQTGDSVSGSPLTQAFNSPNVAGTNGSTLSVTNFTGVNDGNGGGNYTVTVNTAMGTITPLAVTLTGTRTYDGMTDAAGTILSATNDLDGANLTIGGTGVLASKNVGNEALTSTGGSLTGLTLGGSAATNYTLASATGSVNVTKAGLVISAVTQTKTYDATTTSTGTPTVVGLQTGDSVSGSPLTQAFNSPNVAGTNGSTLSVTNFTGVNDGNGGGNYTVTVNTAMGTITPLAVTLTGTRTYDGMTDAAGTILSATNDLDGANLTIGGTGVLASKNVGNEALTSTGGSLTGLTLGGSAATNYTLASATGSVNVTKAGLVISAVTQTKTYDATTSSTGTPTITGLQTGDSVSGSPLTQAFNSANVAGTNGSTLSVTNFTGVNDGNGGGNYTVTVNTAMGTITPLAVTLTGTRTYDGMTDAAGTILSATNDLDGANLTIGGTGVLASKNVGNEALTSTGGSLTGLTLGGSAATNYTLASATGSVNVTKAGLVISAVTQTKTYDATTSSTGTPTITGLQTGDSVSGSPLTQAFNSPNVAGTNGSTLSVTNFTGVNDGNGGGNYTVTVNTAMGTITPLAVTLTGTRTYDGMTDAAGTILSATNDLDGANLTIGGTGVLASKNVGNEALTSTGGSLTGLTLGGSAATNYTLASATGSVNVTKAGLVISAVTQTKTYDATTTSTGTPTITGLQTGDSVSGSPLTQAFNSANVAGTNGSTLSVTNFTGVNDGNGGGNYTVTVNTAMGTITPLAVTLTGTRTYDGMTDAAGTILSATNDLDGANLTIGGTGVLAGKNVGNEALTSTGGSLTGLTLGGSAATNYTLASATGSVNVTKAGLVISAVTQTKTYDATTTSTGTPTVVGLQTGDSVSGSPLTQAFNSPNVAGTNGSTLSVTNFTGVNDGNGGGNYTVTVNTAMGTITPLAVTLTGTRTYDGMTDAAGTILSATNDLDGANLTIGGTGVLAGKNVGNEALTSTGGSLTGLTLGGSAATNYTLASATGSVNVTKAGLVISAVTDTKVYDGGVSSVGTPTITGLQTGDSVSGSPLTQIFGSKNVLGTNGSTLSVNNFTGVNDGNGGANYNVTVNTAMGTITPLAVNETGTRVYNGTPGVDGSIITIANAIPGDTVSVTGTGTLGGKDTGTQTITNPGTLTLTGGDAGNYTTTGGSSAITITPFAVTLAGTRVYDGNTDGNAPILGVTNAFAGDTVTVASGTSTIASKNVGPEAITNFGTLALGGASAGDYTLTGATGTVTVTPLAVTLAGTRVYDGLTDGNAPILSVTNAIAGDSPTVASGTSTIASKNVGPEGITSVGTLALGNNPNGNYTLVGATGVVTVTPLSVVATGTRVYDGTPGVNGPILTITDKIPGDTVSIIGTGTLTGKDKGPQTVSTIGTLALTGGDAGNYVFNPAAATVTITPFAVNLAGTRTYDGLTDGNSNILSVTNAFAGDTVNVASGTSTIANKNVGTEGITNFGTLALGNNMAGDYTLVGATGAVKVTPLALTVTAVNTPKVYDGTTGSSGTPVITVGALQGTDTGAFIQQFGTKNAGTGLTLTPSGVVTDGNGGNNYIVTFAPITTGVISPRPVVLNGTRPFDNTPGALASILNITNLVSGDSVTLGGVATLASGSPGIEPINNFSGLTLAGGPAADYTFVGATGTVLVTPVIMPTIAEILTVPSTQTSSGTGETVTFSAFSGGILTLTPKQNGVVTGTIATIDGNDYQPDAQLSCTLGQDGCVQNGVAVTPPK